MDNKSGDMSRRQQTLALMIVLVLIAFFAWRYAETKDRPCAKLLGGTDMSCAAAAAAARIRAGY